jgi:hypothetical protein
VTTRNCESVDRGAFCEVISLKIFLNNLLGDFFDSLAIDRSFFGRSKIYGLGIILCNFSYEKG